MDLIFSVIWPGILSACGHIYALIIAVRALNSSARAKFALAFFLLAVPTAIALPWLAFSIAFGFDYLCVREVLGMNFCDSLRWGSILILLVGNILSLLMVRRHFSPQI